MKEKRYTSGELASAAGLTIRTIQHYDNIGLLRSAGRTAGGRRYYTEDDLIRLEQIVLYKSLDFSLEQIKEQILLQPSQKELQSVFKNQQLLLLQKMEHLHTAFAALDIMSDMLEAGKEVPLELFLQFLSVLPGDDIFTQAPQMFTKNQQDMLALHFQDLEPIQHFYHRWKEMMLKAMVLLREGLAPEDCQVQSLIKDWWQEIIAITGGDLELITQLSKPHLEEQIPTRKSEILSATQQLLDRAFQIFAEESGLPSTVSETKGGKENDSTEESDKEIRQ